MKRLLFVLAAATLVLFSSCRHEDFDLLKHPIHVQGGANLNLGAPVGTGEMTVDDLFKMISDPMIDSLIDSTQNVITLHYETSFSDTLGGSTISIGAKKAIGKTKLGSLPFGQNRVNRNWTPRRTANDRKWSPKISGRVNVAKTGKFTAKGGAYAAKDPSTPDNIFHFDTVMSKPLPLDMLNESNFFSNADFEIAEVGFDLKLDLQAICEEPGANYLNRYITVTVDSIKMFYYNDGQETQLHQSALDNQGAAIAGPYSPNGIGIAQQPMHIVIDSLNVAEIINAKPDSVKAQFRIQLDVARQLVKDVVSDEDTVGLYLVDINIDNLTFDDLSDFNEDEMMNRLENNLANKDTLDVINYLLGTHLNLDNPQTIFDFFHDKVDTSIHDTVDLLPLLGFDTVGYEQRTEEFYLNILANLGIIEDTTRLAIGAKVGMLNEAGDDFDSCRLIIIAMNHEIEDCHDTLGMIGVIEPNLITTDPSGETIYDTNYFIQWMTGRPDVTLDSTDALLDVAGIDTTQPDWENQLLLNIGIDTADPDFRNNIVDSLTGGHGTDDTVYFLNLALNNPVPPVHYPAATTEDTLALFNVFGMGSLVTEEGLLALFTPAELAAYATMTNSQKDAALHAKQSYVLDSVMPQIVDSVTGRVKTYLDSMMRDYAKNKLEPYLEDRVLDAISQRLQDSIIPRVEEFMETNITNYINDSIIPSFEQEVVDSIEHRVEGYVTHIMDSIVNDFVDSKVNAFTSLKDTITSIMDDVSKAKFAYNATVAVNIPFALSIGQLSQPMWMKLWDEGNAPVDIDAILNALPGFVQPGNEEDNSYIGESYFNMRMANGMPLEFSIKATLCKADSTDLITLIDNDTVKAAQLQLMDGWTDRWEAGDTTVSLVRATLNEEKLKKLKKSSLLRLDLSLTSNNKIVYVKRSDKLAFQAYIQANASARVDIPIINKPTGIIPASLHKIW